MDDMGARLERESERVTLAPGAETRLFERRRRRERNRRAGALVVGLSVTVAIAVFALQGASVVDDGGQTGFGSPSPGANNAIAGSYTTRLPGTDPSVSRFGLGGSYTMRLRPSGILLLSVPPRFQPEGLSSILFRLSGNLFTTNAFTNLDCRNAVGTYRWSLENGVLRFDPVDESCEIRRVLFSSRPWTSSSV
jgi:hypothetical protein